MVFQMICAYAAIAVVTQMKYNNSFFGITAQIVLCATKYLGFHISPIYCNFPIKRICGGYTCTNSHNFHMNSNVLMFEDMKCIIIR
jgi:hypothetical protein